MSTDEPFSGSSGSTSDTSLTSDDGTRIKWDNVAAAILGGILGTIGLGIADLIDILVSIPVALLETVQTAFTGPVSRAIFGLPSVLFDQAVQPAIEFVGSLGILGFPVALGFVIATAWLAAKIRSEVL